MLDLRLREEFKGRRLKGTTVDFTNQSKTGALDVSAAEFLKITYPSHDLLKLVEATGPDQSRPVVLLGSRGQGKSHLLAALFHLCKSAQAGQAWLGEWSDRLNNPQIGALKLRSDCCVIAESLHLQRYKHLWDILFQQHPKGELFLGKWLGMGDQKTDVPSDKLLVEMFTAQPTVLILDEFQTWFDGLTNTKQYPWRTWAFNFIQILSEIAQKNPELLVLVVSVREGSSDAYQQVHRVNPVLVDFKGPLAKRDRQRLLLYRIFENRMQIPPAQIDAIVQGHVSEYFRLAKIPQPEQERRQAEFLEAWPYAPHLLRLLDDQVLIATDAQDTRDLIRILVDVYKTSDPNRPILTAADFSLTSEKSGVASLLDSVANQLHKDLREKAIRNLEAVRDAVPNSTTALPHLEEIISSLWLRSLTVDRQVGAEQAELQIDITRDCAIDDNQFEAELAMIVENSFNIHPLGSRLVLKNEENPQAKLLAHSKNDKLFQQGEDIEHLAKEVRAVIGGPEHLSQQYRIVVLKKQWASDPWSEFEEKDRPENWQDARLSMVVIPEHPDKVDAVLGGWLCSHLQKGRNTIRFLLPQKGTPNIYYDRELIVLARAVYLAMQWRKTEATYGDLQTKFQQELRGKLRGRFDRFAVLDVWNFAEPAKCQFQELAHSAQGDDIPEAVNSIIKNDVFMDEDFDEYVLLLAKDTESVGKLLRDLREPRPGGKTCIPWLGEIEVKERVIRLCADSQIAINVRGMDMLQARPGESANDAWHRMKGKLGTGKHLDDTTLHLPDAVVTSGGMTPPAATAPGGDAASGVGGVTAGPGDTLPGLPGSTATAGAGAPPGGLFGGGDGGMATPVRQPHFAAPTSGLNLLGQVESWGIGPATPVANVSLTASKMTKSQLEVLMRLLGDGISSASISLPGMTGAQLQQLLKQLPDGVTYGLNLEKETE